MRKYIVLLILLSCGSVEAGVTDCTNFVTLGDSITKASIHDDITADGVGYQPILAGLLTTAWGHPVTIQNNGVSGETSAVGLSRTTTVINNNPSAGCFLVMYGTNDAFTPVPSGIGLFIGDPGYSGSFKSNMQQIVDKIKTAGKYPFLAYVPKAFAPREFLNPDLSEYNEVIYELVSENSISVAPPNFYTWFEAHPEEMDDDLHPNGLGYISMANLWYSAFMALPSQVNSSIFCTIMGTVK
jgi:lysophospholipase L1-like esterase